MKSGAFSFSVSRICCDDASSSLAHPNICTIHEIGETDGEFYIVMELVEGKSLHAMSVDAGLPPEPVGRLLQVGWRTWWMLSPVFNA